MVFEGELAVKLHAEEVEVCTSSERNHREERVAMGDRGGVGFTAMDLLTTKALVLLGFSIIQ